MTGSKFWPGLAFVSGAVATIAVVFLIAMFVSFAVGARSTGLTFGAINDVLGLIAYALALPLPLLLHGLLRRRSPVLSSGALVLGIGALVAIAILQAMLVLGALTFEQQIGPVAIAFIALGGWFVTIGYLGRSAGLLPNGVRIGLLAATYVGYPIWAFWLGRRLQQHASNES
jgi:hypothetical protein